MKKGVSPVIATIILIAITITIASVLYFWSFNAVKNLSPPTTKCNEAVFNAGIYPVINSPTEDKEELEQKNNFEVENIGNVILKGFIIYFKNNEKGTQDSLIVYSSVNPGESISELITVPIDYYKEKNNFEVFVSPIIPLDNKFLECPESFTIKIK